MRFLIVFMAIPLLADSLTVDKREVMQIADGVYAIRHRDPSPGWVQGNTIVVIGAREVLVVDSCQVSSAAREDIAEIRRWTDKPVRYLVNTHWHLDHNGGNHDYMEAFPGLSIVTHTETRAMMDAQVPRMASNGATDTAKRVETLKQRLASGVGSDGKPISDERRALVTDAVKRQESLIGELKDLVYQRPTLTFKDSLEIDLGDRTVQVLFLGRGNTGGDAVVYLPKEKIVATGDLLVSPVPFAFDGYPSEWVRTLERIKELDAAVIVPGHGELMRDHIFLGRVLEMMRSVISQIDAQLRRDFEVKLEDVRKAVDLKSQRALFSGGDDRAAEFFDQAIGSSFVELAFHEAKQR